MIKSTNIFIMPTAGASSSAKGTVIDNALGAENKFRDLIMGVDDNTVRHDLSDNKTLEQNRTKSNAHEEHEIEGVELHYSNVEMLRNIENALSTDFIRVLRTSPIETHVVSDSGIESRSETLDVRVTPIDTRSNVVKSNVDIQASFAALSRDLPLPDPVMSFIGEYTPNKSKLVNDESESFKYSAEPVVSKNALPTDVRLEESPKLATAILTTSSGARAKKIESLVYVTWLATGELSFTGNVNLSSVAKDISSPTTSFTALSRVSSGFSLAPIPYPGYPVSGQVNAATVGCPAGHSSASIENVVSPKEISSLIVLRFPEFAKRKLTVVNEDGAVDIVIRDYEVSDKEMMDIALSISTHFSASGKTLRSLTINGIRVN